MLSKHSTIQQWKTCLLIIIALILVSSIHAFQMPTAATLQLRASLVSPPPPPPPTTTATTTETEPLSLESKEFTATHLSRMTSSLLLLVPPSIANAFDTMDDVEVAELPPVYVPILFAIAIMVGVGVLTSSLGDVYSEEASLGLMSGAKAKKERERSRSSYFKRSD